MMTLIQFFEESVKKFPKNIYLREKLSDRYEGVTYQEVRESVIRLAAGLMGVGLQPGDRVALLSEGRNGWVIGELAVLYNGAVNVPLSVKLTEPEIRFRLEHAEVRMVITSGRFLHIIRKIREGLPMIRLVVVMDEPAVAEAGETTFERLYETGEEYLSANRSSVEQRGAAVKPNDLANICYTSGTTADPKGIMLTHWNYVANVLQCYSLMHVDETFRTLLILPWDHAFAHTVGIYCMMGKGTSLASVQVGKTQMETLRNLSSNIREIRPTFLLSVPAMAVNFRKNIEKSIAEKGKFTQRLFRHALKISIRYNGNGWNRGKGLSWLLKPLIALYDKLIFSKIRDGFGGELRFFIGGGALLDIELQRFFYAIGIPMFQGYGLTEAAPVISSNAIQRHKMGSSGFLVDDLELKICDGQGKMLPVGEKGEIVVRGANVMKGYWRNPEATAETIREGWLFTGDMGYMDEEGFLYVLGRFKSLLIADDGEKFSPEGLEESFCGDSEWIDQCMLYNNQNPYTVALVVPNKDAALSNLSKKGLQPGSQEGIDEVLAQIERVFQTYRKGGIHYDRFPQRWLPASVGILSEPITEENGLLNSSLKMVRGKVVARYEELITNLYTPEAKNILNERNRKAIMLLLGS
ncbi:MAG: AMP-binding protein [Bacteroidia bacterium]|nr:AMP-binding protein [Bacteroidia bacterium]